VSSLMNAADTIQQSWVLLSHQWRTTESLWTDAVERQFEKVYMEEYEPCVFSALRELSRLDQVIAQARRDVK
jgi:hypothetical protein